MLRERKMNRPYAILAVKSICSAAFPLPGANTHTHTRRIEKCVYISGLNVIFSLLLLLLLHARQIHERKSLIFAQRRSFLNYWFLCKQKNINLKDEWVCYNFHTWKCYLFSLRSLLFRTIAVEKSASAYLIKRASFI